MLLVTGRSPRLALPFAPRAPDFSEALLRDGASETRARQ
jgi:hypothetical protein